SKDIDRRPVETSTLAPLVRQDRESRKPTGLRARDRLDIAAHDAPETPHARPTKRRGLVSAHAAEWYAGFEVEQIENGLVEPRRGRRSQPPGPDASIERKPGLRTRSLRLRTPRGRP